MLTIYYYYCYYYYHYYYLHQGGFIPTDICLFFCLSCYKITSVWVLLKFSVYCCWCCWSSGICPSSGSWFSWGSFVPLRPLIASVTCWGPEPPKPLQSSSTAPVTWSPGIIGGVSSATELWLYPFSVVPEHKRVELSRRTELRWTKKGQFNKGDQVGDESRREPERKQTSHELFFHIYPLIVKELLLNGKNEVSWIRSDKIAGSCQPPLVSSSCSTSPLWHPVRASPKPRLTWCDCPPAGAGRTAPVCHLHPFGSFAATVILSRVATEAYGNQRDLEHPSSLRPSAQPLRGHFTNGKPSKSGSRQVFYRNTENTRENAAS